MYICVYINLEKEGDEDKKEDEEGGSTSPLISDFYPPDLGTCAFDL